MLFYTIATVVRKDWLNEKKTISEDAKTITVQLYLPSL